MEKPGPIFLAFAVILAVAVAGPRFSADARLAEWNVPSERIATPLNVSGDSAGQLFEVSERLPRNLSGGSELELVPGFDVINSMSEPNGVLVQCYNDALPPPNQIIVDQVVPTGQQDGWDLEFIDPSHLHLLYRCSWFLPGQVVSHESWVSMTEQDQHGMPFYCIRCIWKVQDDGLYLYSLSVKFFLKLSSWN